MSLASFFKLHCRMNDSIRGVILYTENISILGCVGSSRNKNRKLCRVSVSDSPTGGLCSRNQFVKVFVVNNFACAVLCYLDIVYLHFTRRILNVIEIKIEFVYRLNSGKLAVTVTRAKLSVNVQL